jgi:transcriptional regulator with XRE-family HTH domain
VNDRSRERQFYTSLGSQIRKTREQAGVTQQYVAGAVGLARSSMANIEAGRQGDVSAFLLVELADVLGAAPGVWLSYAQIGLATDPRQPSSKER